MITDSYILDEFEEHELFMDMETHPLRLIQLDLHCFGLGESLIVFPLVQLGGVYAKAKLKKAKTLPDTTLCGSTLSFSRQVRYHPFGGKTIDRSRY